MAMHAIYFKVGVTDTDWVSTWDDWHIVPEKRPEIATPPLVENYLSIPGLSGKLDLSEILTGRPVYEQREGTWNFIVMNHDNENLYGEWQDRYSAILNAIHGKRLKIRLEDDPEFEYEGRITVGNWDSQNNGTYSKLPISYKCDPFKKNIRTGEYIL